METLRANEIYASAAIRVIAVDSVRCDPQKSNGFCRLFARVEPVSVIVCGAGEDYVVNLAAEISLDELKLKVPGLLDLLATNPK
ncbi:MAG: hypothetical protein OEO19_00340 [Gammaproteobacteria bacterium]|nr:hypothetical protein [Gammaproteobacteria bacterium]MDH3449280.1 hypothetical protein [Gammaproteobacteria bacterium]